MTSPSFACKNAAGSLAEQAKPARHFYAKFFGKGFGETLFYKKGFPQASPLRKAAPHA